MLLPAFRLGRLALKDESLSNTVPSLIAELRMSIRQRAMPLSI